MENQIDPFAKDKVIKLESKETHQRSLESIKYGENLMEALELCDKLKTELENYCIELQVYALALEKCNKTGKKLPKKPSKPEASILFLGRNIFEHM